MKSKIKVNKAVKVSKTHDMETFRDEHGNFIAEFVILSSVEMVLDIPSLPKFAFKKVFRLTINGTNFVKIP